MNTAEIASRFIRAAEIDRITREHVGPAPLRAQQPAVEFVRQYDLQRVPKAVMEWLEARTDKMLVFQPGQFESFSTSRSSSSWGNPPGGSTVGEFRVVVCQPSPTSRAEPARMLFDYVEATQPEQ